MIPPTDLVVPPVVINASSPTCNQMTFFCQIYLWRMTSPRGVPPVVWNHYKRGTPWILISIFLQNVHGKGPQGGGGNIWCGSTGHACTFRYRENKNCVIQKQVVIGRNIFVIVIAKEDLAGLSYQKKARLAPAQPIPLLVCEQQKALFCGIHLILGVCDKLLYVHPSPDIGPRLSNII